MSYKGYDFFYTNGSSHTIGGGFESYQEMGFYSKEMAEYYKKHYNVSWNSCRDVNYATRLSKLLGIKVYNEATQGGGLDRIVRMTYDFIEDNWKKRHNFFIILETPDSSRIDIYYKPEKKYFVANYNNKESFFATPSYFPRPDDLEKYQPDFQVYYEKFYDDDEHHYDNERKITGLYSFCKRENIAIKFMSGQRHYLETFDKNDMMSGLNGFKFDIITWCIENKKQIKHETNFEIIDGHPGYFAHIEYAKIWKDWLDINLEEAYRPNK